MQLSKSDYMLYLRHPAWLWIKKNNAKLLPQVDDATQALFDTGYLFESYAEKLFPDGIKLNWEGYREYLDLPQRTREAIMSGAKTIFQGRLEVGEITCIFDVIQFVGKDEVDLIEIKSSTGPRTNHEHDLAFQAVVLEDSGYKVNKISIVHVNREYVRKGEVNPAEIATMVDVTEKVKKRIDATREDIKRALETAKSPNMPEPTPSVCGLNCTSEWIKIYKLIKGIKPGDGSIYDLYNPSATLIKKLEEASISKLTDIPVVFEGLSDKQRWQVQSVQEKKVLIDKVKLTAFLTEIKYPIYFLDYETLGSVIPYFDGYSPNKQIPFQYSLHFLEKPGAELKHVEYLHSEKSDPIKPLTESLMKDIGPKGSIIAWNMKFEQGCNTDMGKIHPEFADYYDKLNKRFVDLMIPFFDFHYVDAAFGGSASIKQVLPVLIPELSYKDLDISDGLLAQRLWMQAVLDEKRPLEKEKILKDLWDYCGLDTMAMVKIWEYLEKV